jgi:hypothetical protein
MRVDYKGLPAGDIVSCLISFSLPIFPEFFIHGAVFSEPVIVDLHNIVNDLLN